MEYTANTRYVFLSIGRMAPGVGAVRGQHIGAAQQALKVELSLRPQGHQVRLRRISVEGRVCIVCRGLRDGIRLLGP